MAATAEVVVVAVRETPTLPLHLIRMRVATVPIVNTGHQHHQPHMGATHHHRHEMLMPHHRIHMLLYHRIRMEAVAEVVMAERGDRMVVHMEEEVVVVDRMAIHMEDGIEGWVVNLDLLVGQRVY